MLYSTQLDFGWPTPTTRARPLDYLEAPVAVLAPPPAPELFAPPPVPMLPDAELPEPILSSLILSKAPESPTAGVLGPMPPTLALAPFSARAVASPVLLALAAEALPLPRLV